MGAAAGAKELAEVVLAGLRAGINFDIGAVLLLPKAAADGAKASELSVVAYSAEARAPTTWCRPIFRHRSCRRVKPCWPATCGTTTGFRSAIRSAKCGPTA